MSQKKFVITLTKQQAAVARWAVERALMFEPGKERQEELGKLQFWQKLHEVQNIFLEAFGKEVKDVGSYTKRAVLRDRWWRTGARKSMPSSVFTVSRHR